MADRSETRSWPCDFAGKHELPGTVQYYSLATVAPREQISFGLRGTYDDLAKIDPRNDSQMLFYDQIIAGGALLGFVDADHWAGVAIWSSDR